MVEDTAAFLRTHRYTYQMITMNDVLEHVPKQETVSLLEAILSALEPGGNLVINVPQVSGLTSLFCRYNLAGFSSVRFIPQKWLFKWTPRHLAYRLARVIWYGILKLIYTIESPGERHPRTFQFRLVATASRPHHLNSASS